MLDRLCYRMVFSRRGSSSCEDLQDLRTPIKQIDGLEELQGEGRRGEPRPLARNETRQNDHRDPSGPLVDLFEESDTVLTGYHEVGDDDVGLFDCGQRFTGGRHARHAGALELEHTERFAWPFVGIGHNVDHWAVGRTIGIRFTGLFIVERAFGDVAASFDASEVQRLDGLQSCAIKKVRRQGERGVMEVALPLPDRLLVLLCDQRGWWLCLGCLAEKLGVDLAETSRALDELRAEQAACVTQGVCFACLRSDQVASTRLDKAM